MKYKFRPYTKLPPIVVRKTGKVYEIGQHPYYKEHKITEVIDSKGIKHDAFEDELTEIFKNERNNIQNK